MQLLYSRAAPCPEFASVSLLLKGDVIGDTESHRMRDPLLLPSPVSTVSQATSLEALCELHQYLLSVLKAVRSSKDQSNKMATALLQEDERLLGDVQVFRPIKGQGMALHYMLIRDRPTMAPLAQLVLKSSTPAGSASPNIKNLESDLSGVILCVAMTGLPSVFVMSTLHYSLNTRMRDCLEILRKAGTDDAAASASLLATILLTEEESRLTNPMVSAMDSHLFAETDDSKGGILGGKKKSQDGGMDAEFENPLSINSADLARIMVERLAVLSVAESDTNFRKYEGKTTTEKGKSRRRKLGRDADLDGFDFRGEKKWSREATATATNSDAASVKSSASKLQLRQPKKDTARIMGGKASRHASVPALLASNKDTSGRRRQSMEGPTTRSRPTTGSGRQSSDTTRTDWSVDSGGGGSSAFGNQTSTGMLDSGSTSENHFDPFAANSVGTASTTSETTSSTRRNGGGFDTHPLPMDGGFGGDAFGTGMTSPAPHGGRSRSGGFGGEKPRLQVNVALNEDLTCFYKLSRMSSCSVEGVLQVQVKSSVEQPVPFLVSLRDPSNHVQAIQENKRFAEKIGNPAELNYSVSVPKGDNYFPVMRYKCGNELRPVPIRVQTRVRLEGIHWRVALQISSNPHNEDNLTDLTIIMGVPSAVSGESLTTSPAGGVWNASKRSVIWCVSELGSGEKFQLQARFEIEPNAPVSDDEIPKFPVLVRCQCMHAQLSDVEVLVHDLPELVPADVKMKLTRRFRLSHRERP